MSTDRLVLEGAPAKAYGHPTECTEPAPGSVQGTSGQSVSVNGTPIATVATADINFNSHAHAYEDTNDDGIADTCTNFQSHSIDPSTVSQSVTVNGSPAYIDDNAPEATDPGSGGDVEITGTGGNSSVKETT